MLLFLNYTDNCSSLLFSRFQFDYCLLNIFGNYFQGLKTKNNFPSGNKKKHSTVN